MRVHASTSQDKIILTQETIYTQETLRFRFFVTQSVFSVFSIFNVYFFFNCKKTICILFHISRKSCAQLLREIQFLQKFLRETENPHEIDGQKKLFVTTLWVGC
ncbi:MAG: hypothetical protein DRQ99_06635 [Candidatus Parabeggiatoa sp. nov. 3]|nr:MAG: hypothetical protein DRQ99_06635 [Gammaproteobacteria bacterium]